MTPLTPVPGNSFFFAVTPTNKPKISPTHKTPKVQDASSQDIGPELSSTGESHEKSVNHSQNIKFLVTPEMALKDKHFVNDVVGKYNLSPHYPSARAENTEKAGAKTTPKKRPLVIVKADISPIVPKPLSPKVRKILNEKGLRKYIPLFEAEEIDYEVFKSLTEEDLMEIGITSKADIDVIMGAVCFWFHTG